MTRVDLQHQLEDILGSRNVYFQPPSSIQLKYPCIVYNRSAMDEEHANNSYYILATRYLITVIDPNPDNLIHNKILSLPYTKYYRHFVVDNLNHDVYSTFIV